MARESKRNLNNTLAHLNDALDRRAQLDKGRLEDPTLERRARDLALIRAQDDRRRSFDSWLRECRGLVSHAVSGGGA